MHPFVHLPAFRVVVCVECQYAVLPSNINTHLREKKTHNMPKKDRTQIVQAVQSIEGLIWERDELNQLVIPVPGKPPIPLLQPPQKDGIRCGFPDNQQGQCTYVSRHIQQIHEHCEEQHGWENPQKKGRPEAWREVHVPWRSGVYCQHFFVRGPGAQYFEVQAAGTSPAMPCGDVDLEAIKNELNQAMQQANEEERRQITEPEEAREPNP